MIEMVSMGEMAVMDCLVIKDPKDLKENTCTHWYAISLAFAHGWGSWPAMYCTYTLHMHASMVIINVPHRVSNAFIITIVHITVPLLGGTQCT
jgi:hypothetical protein